FLHQVAVLVRHAIRHVARGEPARFVAEEEQLTCFRIEARVRRHRLALELALIVPLPARLERDGIELPPERVLFQSEKAPAVENRRRVRDTAAHTFAAE